MKVPVYTRQTRDNIQLPNVRQTANVNASDFINNTEQAAINATSKGLRQIEGLALQKMQEEQFAADKARVDDARNEFTKFYQDSLFGENGAFNVKGKDVFVQKNSRPLTDNVISEFDKKAAELTNSLSNDRQKLAFSEYSQSLSLKARSKLLQHENKEYGRYRKSVNATAIETNSRTASLFYNDPEQIAEAMQNIEQAAIDNANLDGFDSDYGKAQARQYQTKALKDAVNMSIQHGDFKEGLKIIKSFEQYIEPDVLASVEANLMDEQAAAMLEQSPELLLSATDMDSLEQAIVKQESNGRDFTKNGSPVVSSDGHNSKYKYQVTEATAKNPGFGIKPAANDSPGEYNRIGRELLAVYKKRYDGDPAKIAAAYNAGAGVVDNAIRQGGDNWIKYIPESTRNTYIPNVLSNMKTGTAIDLMSNKQRLVWNNRAKAEIKKRQSVYQAQLKDTIGNQYAQTVSTGKTGDLLTQQHFINAYGYDIGGQKFSEYVETIDYAKTVFAIQDMPVQDAIEQINEEKPTEGDIDFAIKEKRYNNIVKAFNNVQKQRQQDPMLWAQSHGYGVAQLNFESVQNATQELRKRSQIAQKMVDDFGVEFQVLSNREKQDFSNILVKASDDEKISMLHALASGINNPSAYFQTINDIAKDSPAIAIAGQLTVLGNEQAARDILKGERYINPLKDAKESNGKNGVNVRMPSDFNNKFYEQIGASLGQDPDIEQRALSAVRAWYAANAPKADMDLGVDNDLMEQAINNVIGGIEEHAGKKVIVPYGMDYDSFIEEARAQYGVQVGTYEGFYDMPMIPAGFNAYYFQNGDGVLIDDNGSPVVVVIQ